MSHLSESFAVLENGGQRGDVRLGITLAVRRPASEELQASRRMNSDRTVEVWVGLCELQGGLGLVEGASSDNYLCLGGGKRDPWQGESSCATRVLVLGVSRVRLTSYCSLFSL